MTRFERARFEALLSLSSLLLFFSRSLNRAQKALNNSAEWLNRRTTRILERSAAREEIG